MPAPFEMLWLLLLLLLWFVPNDVLSLSPISIKGTKLYTEDGEQFFVKGVVYQKSSSDASIDVLSNTNQCQIDAGLMKELGANTIRVYTVNSTKNHDGCMQAFASQGIYVWVDLSTPVYSINRVDPAWTQQIYNTYTAAIDAFSGYENLLSFTIGNEIINDGNSTMAAPFIKAAVRDIKDFRNARGYRKIPISYTAADVQELRLLTAEYLTCGDSLDSIDIFGMDVYSWCGNSSYYTSGFDRIYTEFDNLNIPSLFSETGCNSDQSRDFQEVATMLGSVFPAVFSGAIVYEWTQEANDYGIVQYDAGNDFPSTLDDYNALKTVFSRASPIGTIQTAYTPSNSAPACPTSNSSWLVDPRTALPTIDGLAVVTARTTYNTQSDTASATGSLMSSASSTSGSNTSNSVDHGLSTGIIAGIAVACAVIGTGAIVGLLIVFRKRRNARKQTNRDGLKEDAAADDYVAHRYSKSELPAQSTASPIPKQELDASKARSELYHEDEKAGRTVRNYSSRVFEMEGSRFPATEMDGK